MVATVALPHPYFPLADILSLYRHLAEFVGLSFSLLQNVIRKGFLIGVFSSMPTGPIAMLCIQRTLSKGRRHGFFTGMGAATSDLFYAFITSFFLSFVNDFIGRHSLLIQIIGCVVILGFGFFIFRSDPARTLSSARSPKSQSVKSDFISAFGLTIVNPAIIGLFIGLFASFNFITSELSFLQSLLGVGAIFLGAISWWALVVILVGTFRRYINIRRLRFLNRLTGALIVIIAIFGLLSPLLGISIFSPV